MLRCAMADVAELVKFGRGVNLIHRGFIMKRDRRTQDKQYWRCTKSGCPGRLHTDFLQPPTILQSAPHGHMPDEELVRSRKVTRDLCLAAEDRPLVPLSQVSS